MVKHVILWQLKDELTAEEKEKAKKEMAAAIEALVGKVPGLLEAKVQIEGLASSNADVLLDTTLEDEEALKVYAIHPDHVYVADTYVRPFAKTRLCMDFEI